MTTADGSGAAVPGRAHLAVQQDLLLPEGGAVQAPQQLRGSYQGRRLQMRLQPRPQPRQPVICMPLRPRLTACCHIALTVSIRMHRAQHLH